MSRVESVRSPNFGQRGLLVHEWLAETGGSENVFEELLKTFPEAVPYCLWNSSKGRFTGINETWLAKSPLKGHKAAALPFMLPTWRRLPKEDADWALISSHLFAHHAKFESNNQPITKLVYAHSPARYIWVPDLDKRGVSTPLVNAASWILRPIDKKRAAEPKAIAANSKYVAERIQLSWGRESEVIYPPVDLTKFSYLQKLSDLEIQVLDQLPSDFILGVSRFIPYKRLDLVIQAGIATGIPVVLAGKGPDSQRLMDIANEKYPGRVIQLNHPSTSLLVELYRRARVLVFPAIEDFGIVPVESMAAGTPVIVNSIGGASESVVDGITGVHVEEWTSKNLYEAVLAAEKTSLSNIIDRAKTFSSERFRSEIRTWVDINVY